MTGKKKIFLIDDDELIVTVLSKALQGEGYEVQSETTSFKNITDKIGAYFPDAVLLDNKLSGMSGLDILKEVKQSGIDSPVIMLTADDTAETAVKAMKLGAADYLTKPFNIEEMKIVISNIIEKKALRQEVDLLRRISSELFDENIIGESGVVMELKNKIKKIAEAQVSSILITGESGTGKELFSRYIHRLMYGDGKSRSKPFVAINCAALPEHLMESELFGHEKGAFTDARTEKKGVFELANGGTILLDEIGEMKPALQSKLLRVLEERSIRRIGGKWDMQVDVTVIATTNRNLSEAVKTGEFRTDLFFRLSTFYLHIPPLRERKDDIPLLARHFLSHYTTRYNKKAIKAFDSQAERLLVSYNWPGNIRELKNLVERLVVLENSEELLPEHLPNWLTGASAGRTAPAADRGFVLPEEGISLDDVEKDLFIQALKKADYNKVTAAKLLGISYDSFRYGIKKYGLK
ncbi:MAG: sigma-54-dependent Fis family transcriptional regulator [Nitrospirae bacterium]|nr:sigma-54-dependent Fis family transcriptional regulator [Nitrospirota bacterium]